VDAASTAVFLAVSLAGDTKGRGKACSGCGRVASFANGFNEIKWSRPAPAERVRAGMCHLLDGSADACMHGIEPSVMAELYHHHQQQPLSALASASSSETSGAGCVEQRRLAESARLVAWLERGVELGDGDLHGCLLRPSCASEAVSCLEQLCDTDQMSWREVCHVMSSCGVMGVRLLDLTGAAPSELPSCCGDAMSAQAGLGWRLVVHATARPIPGAGLSGAAETTARLMAYLSKGGSVGAYRQRGQMLQAWLGSTHEAWEQRVSDASDGGSSSKRTKQSSE
jgi:hypothetical protein